MQIHNVEQGSPEWLKIRLGIPTSSQFSNLITPSGKPSKSREPYMYKLLAEVWSGEPADQYQNDWMVRGNELEPKAAESYEIMNDVEAVQVGFVTNYGAGCSPDRLIGDDGLLEIKCPAPHTHAKNIVKNIVDGKYIPQIQGQLLLTGRKWCDWMSYHPLMDPVIIRVEADKDYQETLKDILIDFNEELDYVKTNKRERK